MEITHEMIHETVFEKHYTCAKDGLIWSVLSQNFCNWFHLSRPVRRLSDPSRLTRRCPVKGLSTNSFEAPKPALSPEAAEIPCLETWTLLTLAAHKAGVITKHKKTWTTFQKTSKTWFYKLPAAIFPVFYQKKIIMCLILSRADNCNKLVSCQGYR